ncbi:MAG: hypothetical protein ACO1SV_23220 [Fimbriimonas sp.]
MNPVDQFEQCLKQLSTSKLPPSDKCRKMLEVNKAIEHYLKRVEAQTFDQRARPAVEEAKNHLRELAAQATQMAETYRQASSATVH